MYVVVIVTSIRLSNTKVTYRLYNKSSLSLDDEGFLRYHNLLERS